MSAIKKLFRRNLKWYRQQRDISQSALSEECGYDRTYVGKIERGEKDPSLEAIIRLTEALDITVLEFFRSGRPETNQTVPRPSKRGEDLYRTIFNETRRMIALINTEGEFIEVNQNFLKYVNFPEQELLGRFLWSCDFWGTSDWREQWLQNKVKEAVGGKVLATTMEVYPDEDFSEHLDFSITPLQNEQGTIEYLMVEAKPLRKSSSEQSIVRQLT